MYSKVTKSNPALLVQLTPHRFEQLYSPESGIDKQSMSCYLICWRSEASESRDFQSQDDVNLKRNHLQYPGRSPKLINST
jgi:hypothetical protein